MERDPHEIRVDSLRDAFLKSSLLQPKQIRKIIRKCKDKSWVRYRYKKSSKYLRKHCLKPYTSMVFPAKAQTYEKMSSEYIWLDVCLHITSMALGIADFARETPGFMKLPHHDRITLLQTNMFQLIVIRWSRYMDLSTGRLLHAEERKLLPEAAFYTQDTGDMKLVAFVFALVKSIAKLKLSDTQLALFSALVLSSPESPGLQFVAEVQQMRDLMAGTLDREVDRTIIADLIAKIAPLKQASRMHMNALIKFKQRFQKYDSFPPLHREIFRFEVDDFSLKASQAKFLEALRSFGIDVTSLLT